MKKSYLGQINCEVCGVEFRKRLYVDVSKNSRYNYCNNVCRKSDKKAFYSEWTDDRRLKYSEKFSGEANPNYGNKWSIEQCESASIRKTKEFESNPDYAYECGKTNRGKKFNKELIHRMHGHRIPESYGRRSHQILEDERIKIGKESSIRWQDPIYAKNILHKLRETNERTGIWTPRHLISAYKLYYREANWINNMIQYFSDTDHENLKEHGMFKPKENNKGWCRDHILTRRIGFELEIPVVLMRHPVNMKFISHAENSKKARTDAKLVYNDKLVLMYKLIRSIIAFDGLWKEHDECIKIIGEKYENLDFERFAHRT